ncbi:MAG: hypothetical protein P1V97_34885 [Planctomycetota bacterium]|nr:hypothetical protein [Planctomycetota bacterium]
MSDEKTFKPFNPLERGELAPGADLTDSPLVPGGKKSQEAAPLSATFPGLVDTPSVGARSRRVLQPVRRVGWVGKRSQARSRFQDISSKSGSNSEHRILGGLRSRGGLLARAKQGTVRKRINLQGHIRGG